MNERSPTGQVVFHPRPLIFIHMPKAGGTTLEGIVKRQYRDGQGKAKAYRFTGSDENIANFKAMPEATRAAFDLLSGHMYFGIHEHVPARCTYMTMLRHPVERVVSLYHYVKRTPTHYLYDYGFGDRVDVEDFVRRPITPEIDNWQTRLLNHQPDSFMPPGSVTDEMFETAISNLREHFAVVGVMERFDETLSVLSREFGWDDVSYERRNVTENRETVGDLPRSAVVAILEANQWDLKLHEAAISYLEEKIIRFSHCE